MMCIILNTDLLQFRLFGAVYFVLPVFFEYLYKVSSIPSSSWKTMENKHVFTLGSWLSFSLITSQPLVVITYSRRTWMLRFKLGNFVQLL